jgi:hypothetical protein
MEEVKGSPEEGEGRGFGGLGDVEVIPAAEESPCPQNSIPEQSEEVEVIQVMCINDFGLEDSFRSGEIYSGHGSAESEFIWVLDTQGELVEVFRDRFEKICSEIDVTESYDLNFFEAFGIN